MAIRDQDLLLERLFVGFDGGIVLENSIGVCRGGRGPGASEAFLFFFFGFLAGDGCGVPVPSLLAEPRPLVPYNFQFSVRRAVALEVQHALVVGG